MPCRQPRAQVGHTVARASDVRQVSATIIAPTSTQDAECTIEEVLLPPIDGPTSLEATTRLIAEAITQWLDEEWTPLDVHKDLGIAAADVCVECPRTSLTYYTQAYRHVRLEGQQEAGAVLLALSNRLLAFPGYRDTFVNAFDVANKVVELLMLDMGTDVCCTSDADHARLQRVKDHLIDTTE